ncbi:hypothetical protein MKX01_019947 [Papaver californicum]|nr:hypothetical protein MKX01_019947 [Papaver californicum]
MVWRIPVWFLEEERLPVVSSSMEEQNKHKILLKSPWEIPRSPVGSGGIFSLLSTHGIVGNLTENGVEYVQVCSLSRASAIVDPLFVGFTDSCGLILESKPMTTVNILTKIST